MLSLLSESWLQLTSGFSLPQNQSLWTLEWVRTKILEEDFRHRQLRGGDDGSSGYGMQGSRRGRDVASVVLDAVQRRTTTPTTDKEVPVGVAVRNLDVGASRVLVAKSKGVADRRGPRHCRSTRGGQEAGPHPDVLYVPGVQVNLLSARQLNDSGVKLQDSGDQMLLVTVAGDVLGRANYTGRVLCTDLRPFATKPSSKSTKVVALRTIASATKSTSDRCYARLAHVGVDTIKSSAKHKVATGLDIEPSTGTDLPCVLCVDRGALRRRLWHQPVTSLAVDVRPSLSTRMCSRRREGSGRHGELVQKAAAEVPPTGELSMKEMSASGPTRGEQPVEGPTLAKQLVNDEDVDDEGELSGGEDSTNNNVVEVPVEKPELRRSVRSRKSPEQLKFHACLSPAAVTTLLNDTEADDDLPKFNPDVHADPDHRWDIATMSVKEALET
ncbi:unnamed protein product [Closterium sp. NIES-53]